MLFKINNERGEINKINFQQCYIQRMKTNNKIELFPFVTFWCEDLQGDYLLAGGEYFMLHRQILNPYSKFLAVLMPFYDFGDFFWPKNHKKASIRLETLS